MRNKQDNANKSCSYVPATRDGDMRLSARRSGLHVGFVAAAQIFCVTESSPPRVASPKLFVINAHSGLHIEDKGLEKAIEMVCNQITNYVNHLGAQSKYNQTLTIAAVKIVDHFMKQTEADNFFDFVLEFPRLKTDFKALVKAHYSFDIFSSEKAKKVYLEPDLLPFD